MLQTEHTLNSTAAALILAASLQIQDTLLREGYDPAYLKDELRAVNPNHVTYFPWCVNVISSVIK